MKSIGLSLEIRVCALELHIDDDSVIPATSLPAHWRAGRPLREERGLRSDGLMPLVHRAKQLADRKFADPTAVFYPVLDRLSEMEPHEDA